jgi:hypothetical protein
VTAELLSPPLEVLGVSVDSVLSVGAQQLAKTRTVSTLFENVERDTALSLVIGFPDVLLLEQELKIIDAKSENALVREKWCAFVIGQQRGFDTRCLWPGSLLHLSIRSNELIN